MSGIGAQSWLLGLDINRYLYSIGNIEKQIAIGALTALAQKTRLDVFRLLVETGPEGLPAGTAGKILGIPSATLSFHLKVLKSSGLVRCKRRGKSRIYSPDLSAVNELIAFLAAPRLGSSFSSRRLDGVLGT